MVFDRMIRTNWAVKVAVISCAFVLACMVQFVRESVVDEGKLTPSLALSETASLDGLSIKDIRLKREPRLGLMSELSLQQVSIILNNSRPLGSVVNIGARDGKDHDPTYPIFASGAAGVVFEGDTTMWDKLTQNLGQYPQVKVAKEFVFPHNISLRLVELGVSVTGPAALDVLKIDIDGFDLQLAQAVLAHGFRPRSILMEINSDVPPPFTFEVLYHPNWTVEFSAGFYGASLGAVAEVLEPFGYSLIFVEFENAEHNVIFVRDDQLKLFPNRQSDMCSAYYAAIKKYGCIHVCNPANFLNTSHPTLSKNVPFLWLENKDTLQAYDLLPYLSEIFHNAGRHTHPDSHVFNVGIVKHMDLVKCVSP